MELTNDTGETVTVEGYWEEPYLRLDAGGGVYRNTRSPATYLNADRQGQTAIPDSADARADPPLGEGRGRPDRALARRPGPLDGRRPTARCRRRPVHLPHGDRRLARPRPRR
jgi:hypothetical protein